MTTPEDDQPDCTQDDNLAEQTDNSGEEELEEVSQDPNAVEDNEDEDDEEDEDASESTGEETQANQE